MKRKTSHQRQLELINELISKGRENGILHQYTQDDYYEQAEIHVNNHKLTNFSSCSYLGLEFDNRLIESSVEAVKKFGSQFSSSRTYLSSTIYYHLEECLENIFGKNVILSPNTSMGHQAVLPTIVDDYDLVIFDQLSHYSMQDLISKLKFRGVGVKINKHNDLNRLREILLENSKHFSKVWYIVDGVYSMYGDLPPYEELKKLLNEFSNLYLYVDDAHGMSWAGQNGSGAFLANFGYHDRIILATSLAKGFGSAGGVFILPNEDWYWKVKNFGGPLTHSGPQQPAVIGASLASAKIHLSDEIYELQDDLAERILYCNQVLKQHDLPLVSESLTPIFFIGLGLTKVGYNMVRRLMDDGFYVNLGIFPAVPQTCTGIRFTITRHHSFEDIEKLAACIAKHLPQALAEEERTVNDIYTAFKSLRHKKTSDKQKHKYSVQKLTTIRDVPKPMWDELFQNKGVFDWNALHFLEKVYSDNINPEDNWDFIYYIIRDEWNNPLVATFCTVAILKDDLLADEQVSQAIEKQRKKDPYYLTSRVLMTGSLITEGSHVYINRAHTEWQKAMMSLLDQIWQDQKEYNAENIMIRDFDKDDLEIRDFFMDQDFVKNEMLEAQIVKNPGWHSPEDYINSLASRRRRLLKRNAIELEHYFDINLVSEPTKEQVNKWYELYKNVSSKNLMINGFPLPRKFFTEVAHDPDWECVEMRISNGNISGETVCILLSYVNSNYNFQIIGMDYNYLLSHKLYKQALYQIIKRGIYHNAGEINLGFTTEFEKRKVGAEAYPKVAYVQMKDDFNQAQINLISKTGKVQQ